MGNHLRIRFESVNKVDIFFIKSYALKLLTSFAMRLVTARPLIEGLVQNYCNSLGHCFFIFCFSDFYPKKLGSEEGIK